MPRQRIGFLRGFGLKTTIDFTHFDLELGMAFKGTAGVDEFQMRKKKRDVRDFEMDCKKSFLLPL